MNNELSKIDTNEMAYEHRNKEALSLLDRVTKGLELTEKQKERKELYKDIFIAYSSGESIHNVADHFGIGRNTVYTALEFFKNTELIKDKEINLAIALMRIRKRMALLNNKLDKEYEVPEKLQSLKKQAMLLKEIRMNEKMELEILGLLKTDNGNEGGGKVLVLTNIRGNGQVNVNTGGTSGK